MEKFTLTLELGNDAMQTYSDIAEALRRLAGRLEEYDNLDVADRGEVRDSNGNTVGTWRTE